MKIHFWGGVGGVTGTKHLLETSTANVLLDCGTFQGHRRETRELNSQLPFDVSGLKAVVLTHGHLDHSGLLPLLIKKGYQGRIYGTAATRDVAEWILKDAAHIQAMDAEYMNKHKIEGAEYAEPLFTEDDVQRVLDVYTPVPYSSKASDWLEIAHGIKLKLFDAGHILGSSAAVVLVTESGMTKTLAYTGDLGRKGAPLLPDPETITENVQTLLLESTYGGRTHESLRQAVARLAELIRVAVARKAKIIMPAFALGRTQELIYVLHRLTDRGEIPRIPIYVDSPLATSLTDVCMRYPETYDEESWQDFGRRGDLPLAFRNLTFVSSTQESKKLNSLPGPWLVISASGMCEAGRILHHLLNNISDPNNLILFTGFQAKHTLGRRIVEGVKTVRIFGGHYPVRAEVHVFNEFSAHADQPELVEYARSLNGLENIFLVHGESDESEKLQSALRAANPAWFVHIPGIGEAYDL
jgi:metallo-beta-lactamase family protein